MKLSVAGGENSTKKKLDFVDSALEKKYEKREGTPPPPRVYSQEKRLKKGGTPKKFAPNHSEVGSHEECRSSQ